jgi:hypothetical protein
VALRAVLAGACHAKSLGASAGIAESENRALVAHFVAAGGVRQGSRPALAAALQISARLAWAMRDWRPPWADRDTGRTGDLLAGFGAAKPHRKSRAILENPVRLLALAFGVKARGLSGEGAVVLPLASA